MGSSELVSALVPAYNHSAFVGECLAGLAAQTHRPLELLVADDASRDGTGGAIQDYLDSHAGAFERVVFVRHTANAGLAATLNELLSRARGEYVFLNASDDRAAPHAIATLLSVLRADRDAALAVGDSVIIGPDGERVYWGPNRETLQTEDGAAYRTWVEYLRAVNRPGVFDRRMFGRPGTLHRVNYIPNGKLFRRRAILSAGGWRSGVLEDWDLNFRLAQRHRLRYVDEVLFAYRWHEGNTVRDRERMDALQAGTQAAIARLMRDPRVRARVLTHRDARARLRIWARRLRP